MTEEEKYLQAVGQRIRELRIENGLTQEELAHQSGLHRTYISTLETGQRNLALLNLRRLANVFNLSISTLLENIS